MTKLEQIVKRAKAMKKAHPRKYSKWTDYIKAAAKTMPKSVSGVKRKPAAKKATAAKSTHKDTRSHNVNVKVVSGVKVTKSVSSDAIKAIKDTAIKIESYKKEVDKLLVILKEKYSRKPYSISDKVKLQNEVSDLKEAIKILKETTVKFKKLI